MRRYFIAVLNALGLRGSAVAYRHIAKLEKTANKLNTAVAHIEEDIANEAVSIGRDRDAFELQIQERADRQTQRLSDRGRALRVAIRIAAIIS